MQYQPFAPRHFDQVIELGNLVHGDNYLDSNEVEDLYTRSWHKDINASWVALDEKGQLIGFRLTIAAPHWQPDRWCSPDRWKLPVDAVCYFKSNTIAESARGQGIGGELLARSVECVKRQGALAGLAHIWLASPGNSAYRYFSKAGGVLVKEHYNRWQQWSLEEGYICPVCGSLCTCTAAEMLLTFDDK